MEIATRGEIRLLSRGNICEKPYALGEWFFAINYNALPGIEALEKRLADSV